MGADAVKVTLTPAEMLVGITIGLYRNFWSLCRGLQDRHGHDGSGWNLHIEGACGELACAKALGVYWSPTINTFKSGGDVGPYQVRTRSRADYDLIIRRDDSPDAVFVLVLGRTPSFEVVGWITGAAARQEAWVAAHGGREPAWFIPRAALKPMADLPTPQLEAAE